MNSPVTPNDDATTFTIKEDGIYQISLIVHASKDSGDPDFDAEIGMFWNVAITPQSRCVLQLRGGSRSDSASNTFVMKFVAGDVLSFGNQSAKPVDVFGSYLSIQKLAKL
jgi:hypothetical protein